jgi:hypothetical protein
MMQFQVRHLAIGLMLIATAGTAAAQTDAGKGASLSRAQVKMERDEFLRTHRWDEASETWVLKAGIEPPSGVKSRAEMKAERDKFLSNNRWDDAKNAWVPLKGEPRDIGTMSKEQVRAEARQFMRSHRWDEASETWVEKGQSKKKQ